MEAREWHAGRDGRRGPREEDSGVAAGLGGQSPGETGQEEGRGRGLLVCPACVALNPQERQTLLNKPGFPESSHSPSSVALGNAFNIF